MKTISSLAQLEPYGVYPLTGEADRLHYRCLCDLDERGVTLVAEALGLAISPSVVEAVGYCKEVPQGMYTNWNSGGTDHPHVACVMLPYDAWTWLAPIALTKDKDVHYVIKTRPYTEPAPGPKVVGMGAPSRQDVQGVFGLENGERLCLRERAQYDDNGVDYTHYFYELERDGTKYTWPKQSYGEVTWVHNLHQGREMRNRHQMTGRTE